MNGKVIYALLGLILVIGALGSLWYIRQNQGGPTRTGFVKLERAAPTQITPPLAEDPSSENDDPYKNF